jgi:thymidylate synthase
VRTQLERTPYVLPTLTVDTAPSLFDYTPEHIHLHDYEHHPALPALIAV